MAVAYMLRNTPLPAAMANFNQFLPNQRWDPKRRLHCAIDLSLNSMIWPVAMMLQSGRIGLWLKKIN